jgi:XRE family transcriptional regulator, master regulator for biofilm formation
MPRSLRSKQAPGTKRLGATLRKLRTERGMTATQLVKETGLSRSYLAYLETGRFTEIGLEKFTRLISAMDLSADEVLRLAGYLPAKSRRATPVADVLRSRYKLAPDKLQMVVDLLEFLGRREHRSAARSKATT